MKLKSLTAVVPLITLVGVLAACGGGSDDEAGSPTVFSVSPATLSVTSGVAGACYAGYVGEIFIYGGTAPYRIDNSNLLLGVTVSKTTVEHRGESFTVSYTGAACFDPATVNVVDSLNHVVTLSLTSKAGT